MNLLSLFWGHSISASVDIYPPHTSLLYSWPDLTLPYCLSLPHSFGPTFCHTPHCFFVDASVDGSLSRSWLWICKRRQYLIKSCQFVCGWAADPPTEPREPGDRAPSPLTLESSGSCILNSSQTTFAQRGSQVCQCCCCGCSSVAHESCSCFFLLVRTSHPQFAAISTVCYLQFDFAVAFSLSLSLSLSRFSRQRQNMTDKHSTTQMAVFKSAFL